MAIDRVRWRHLTFNAFTTLELYSLLRFRQKVFVVEQNCPYVDADGQDLDAHHILGLRDLIIVCCSRLVPPRPNTDFWSMGRVAVDRASRKKGVGEALVKESLRYIDQDDLRGEVRISAQAYLKEFYEKFGFIVSGDGYDEDGIFHLPMLRKVSL
jgi:ElaA protein